MAVEVMEQGLIYQDRTTKAACIKSISLKKGGGSEKAGADGKPAAKKQEIREVYLARHGLYGIKMLLKRRRLNL